MVKRMKEREERNMSKERGNKREENERERDEKPFQFQIKKLICST